MDEAERLCDRVAIVDQGRMIALGTPQELIATLGGEHVIEFAWVGSDGNGQLDATEFVELPGVSQARRVGERVCLSVREPHVVLPAVLAKIASLDGQLTGLSTRHASLEDVFVNLAGRQLSDDAAKPGDQRHRCNDFVSRKGAKRNVITTKDTKNTKKSELLSRIRFDNHFLCVLRALRGYSISFAPCAFARDLSANCHSLLRMSIEETNAEPTHRYWPLGQLILARVREFVREPEALFWVYGFPILMTIGLGIAFRNKPVEKIVVAIVEGPYAAATEEALKSPDGPARFEAEIFTADEARQRLRTGRADIVVTQDRSDCQAAVCL